MLDALLSDFRWYRRWRGGVWYKVVPRPDPYIEVWVRGPLLWEHVYEIEIY
jgi:hypothetical protein